MEFDRLSDGLFLSDDRARRQSNNGKHKKKEPQAEPRKYFPKIASETARVLSEKKLDGFARSGCSGSNNRNLFSVKIVIPEGGPKGIKSRTQKRKFVLPERPARNVKPINAACTSEARNDRVFHCDAKWKRSVPDWTLSPRNRTNRIEE